MDREILHCDLNNFFASVEMLYYPQMRFVPMAVCGDVKSRHGIILAKNELAKSYHVATAEPVWQAQKKCPALQFVPPHHERYRYYSKKVQDIYMRYTDQVEAFSIDECWLDVTQSRHLFAKSAEELAYQIKETIKKELGLTVSIGVSYNKIFAKMGSDYKKPDAVTVISQDNYTSILFPLPISSLLFVGKSAQKTLERLGIHTIGQLAKYDPKILQQHLGKMGQTIYQYANGQDCSAVKYYYDKDPVKSIGKGKTFSQDICGMQQIKKELYPLVDYVAFRLRKEHLKCHTISITIKTPLLKIISRQKALLSPTCLSQEILQTALALIEKNWDIHKPIRMLTITAMNLTAASDGEQMNLFELENHRKKEKQEKVEFLVDDLKKKYGTNKIRFGTSIDPTKE